MTQYVPGANRPEDAQLAGNAEREFQAVLNIEPDNLVALESLASLEYNRAQGNQPTSEKEHHLDKAAKWYQRILTAHPDHKLAHYSLGVIAWAKFYPELMQARQRLGMKPNDPGPLKDEKVKADLQARMSQAIDEGVKHLEQAITIDPKYDDAMAYLNLLYRERADLLNTEAEYEHDVQIADSWVRRALETKREKMEAQQPQTASQGLIRSEGVGSIPPPPPNLPSTGASGQFRLASNAMAEKLIEKAEPEYPVLAKEARIQGRVIFDTLILKDGTVGSFAVVSGHPILVPAAADALRKYRYQPTLLNGHPIEVRSRVEITFLLQ